MNQLPPQDTKALEELRRFLTKHPNRAARWSISAFETTLRAEGKCEYCDVDLLGNLAAFWSGQIDHIIPLGKGGENDDWEKNLALACTQCNSIKGRKLPDGMDIGKLKGLKRSDRVNAFREIIRKGGEERLLKEAHERFRDLLRPEGKACPGPTQ